MKVVVDTNVIISHILVPTGIPAQIIEYRQKKLIELLTSEPILAECRRVLRYKRIRARHHLIDDQIDLAVDAFRKIAVTVKVDMHLDVITKDSDDNRIIECAVVGGADYIVSGDAHLLNVEEYKGIRILSPATFLHLLKQGHFS
jgi:putative PIN family toxin of toxin-antitoxin system